MRFPLNPETAAAFAALRTYPYGAREALRQIKSYAIDAGECLMVLDDALFLRCVPVAFAFEWELISETIESGYRVANP